MKPMPLKEYLSDPCPSPSLDSSTAWAILDRSPKHAWAAHPRLNVRPIDNDANSAMDIGSAAHALFLEKDESRLVMVEADDWRTKSAREARDAAHADGKIPLLPKQYNAVCLAVEQSLLAVQRCEDLMELAPMQDHPICEQVCLWQEGETWCRARPDLVSADFNVVVNYKTTGASASPGRFGSMIVRDGYHIQAYHHARGIFSETGKMPHCLWLAQEIEPPYAASIVGASPALMAMAEAQWAHALSTFRNCMASGEWPAYPSRVCWIEPRPWEMEKWQSRPDIDAPKPITAGTETNCHHCRSTDDVQIDDVLPTCAKCRAEMAEIFG